MSEYQERPRSTQNAAKPSPDRAPLTKKAQAPTPAEKSRIPAPGEASQPKKSIFDGASHVRPTIQRGEPSVEGTSAEGQPQELLEGEPFIAGVSSGDVIQGKLGHCWFVGALMAIARSKPELIQNMIKPAGRNEWAVTLHFPDMTGRLEAEVVTVDARVPVVAPSTPSQPATPHFAHGSDLDGKKSELWVLLIEKAYAKVHGKYAHLIGGSIPRDHAGMEIVTGKRDGRIDPRAPRDQLLNELDIAFRFARKAVTFGTVNEMHPNARTAKAHNPKIQTNHTYALDGVDKARGTVELLNPWGSGHVSSVSIDIVQRVVDEIRTNG